MDYKSSTDNELGMAFVAKKDMYAFAELYSRHIGDLRKYLRAKGLGFGNEEDIAHDVFMKVWSNAELYDPEQNFRVWLWVSAKNALYNSVRNRRTRQEYQQRYLQVERSFEPKKDSDNRMRQVNEAIKELKHEFQEILALKYASNLTVQEISEVLGIPKGTVKSRLYYSLKEIKNHIDHVK